MNNYEKYKEYRTFLKMNINDIITDLLTELKKFEGLNKIIIQGYTPSFNDGDPCEHWSTAYFANEDLSEVVEWESHNEWLGIPDDLDYDEMMGFIEQHPINTYDKIQSTAITHIISDLEVLMEEKYDTNFVITIDLTGETPVLKKSHYDCGY